jgi:hypothetical protein
LSLFASLYERCNHRRVITNVDESLYSLYGVFKFHCQLIGAISGHGVKRVSDCNHLRHQGNFVALQALRIPQAINHFVVHVHARQKFFHRPYL